MSMGLRGMVGPPDERAGCGPLEVSTNDCSYGTMG
jgi:hypothetical protein